VCQEATGTFTFPVYFEWPDRLRIPLVAQRSVWVNRKPGKEAAAARSTGLRPIHFSYRGNGRGFQLLGGNDYKIVIIGKKNFCAVFRRPRNESVNVKTTKSVLAIAIGVGLTLGAAAQPGEHPGEKVDMKSLRASVQETIKEKAAGGNFVKILREDDPDGRWNYEVFVKANGKESGFEVDPNGKFVKNHSE
jgi:hypothetical protein